MNWGKLGLIFVPSRQRRWMRTHAALPIAENLENDIYRIYFTSRDEENRSHIGQLHLEISSPENILSVSEESLLHPGPVGHFDCDGVLTSCVVKYEGKHFLYYTGWNRGGRDHLWYGNIGLAISEDNGTTFRKVLSSPIMGRGEFDPCLVVSPCVLIENGIWRMWYVSGFKWEERGTRLHPYYDVKYAQSKNGIDWERKGMVCIALRPGESNIARPCVIKDHGLYKMWYSYDAGQGYRIGYSESNDGLSWTRLDDEAGIDVSSTGWDSEALAYPWVFRHGRRMYMIYNGNQFGKDGFGLAVSMDKD